MNKIYSGIAIVLIILAVGFAFVRYDKRALNNTPENPGEEVFCTMDAKMCPDGSYVGRVAPNCEFAACPVSTTPSSLKIGDRVLQNGVYITPIEVTADSRCPVGVVCVWAGEVSVKVRLEKDTFTTETVMKEGATFSYQGKEITLVSVSPEPKEGQPIGKAEYKFVFQVK